MKRRKCRARTARPGITLRTSGSGACRGRPCAAEPEPQREADDHHRHAEPLPLAQAQGAQAEEVVGLAEVLGKEAQRAVADQEQARDLAAAALLLAVDLQDDEQQHVFV